MIPGYARLLAFILLFLAALQLPAVFDQYQQRLNQKFNDTQQSLSGFQEAANKHFKGDLKALIEAYRTSSDPAFSDQSPAVAALYRDSVQLQGQIDALKAPLLTQVTQLPQQINRPLLQEVVQQFNYNGSLSQTAIAKVAAVVFVLMLLVETILRTVFNLLAYIFIVPKRVKR
jgi:hypothetical protein